MDLSRSFKARAPPLIAASRDQCHLPPMPTLFAVAGSIVNFVACVNYVRAILKGEAAPNRVTWFLWALVPLIAGVAQLRAGVGVSTLVVLSVGAGPACVVLASFVKRAGSW